MLPPAHRHASTTSHYHTKLSLLLDTYCEERATRFRARILSTYRTKNLCFVDEFHSNRATPQRHFGYALIGLRAESSRGISARGRRHSVIAAFDETLGHVAHRTVEGSLDLETTLDFLQNDLLPRMNAFQDGDEERSVLVLDNLWTHHEAQVRALCALYGVVLEFLPAYSPNIAPHEKGIRTAKDWMRTNANAISGLDVIQMVDVALQAVGPAAMVAALHECGYM